MTDSRPEQPLSGHHRRYLQRSVPWSCLGWAGVPRCQSSERLTLSPYLAATARIQTANPRAPTSPPRRSIGHPSRRNAVHARPALVQTNTLILVPFAETELHVVEAQGVCRNTRNHEWPLVPHMAENKQQPVGKHLAHRRLRRLDIKLKWGPPQTIPRLGHPKQQMRAKALTFHVAVQSHKPKHIQRQRQARDELQDPQDTTGRNPANWRSSECNLAQSL